MNDEDSKSLLDEARLTQISVVVLMALLFTIVGYLAPAMYAGVTPASDHVTVHQFTAQDVNLNNTEHYVCMDKSTYDTGGQTATVYFELYTISQDGTRYQIRSHTERRHLSEGRHSVIIELGLPEDLPEGIYYYSAIFEFTLADGRVTKQLERTSGSFKVVEDHNTSSLQNFSKTCGASRQQ